MAKTKKNLDFFWVDEFIENVRPYIFVRLEDNLLIKRPNNAVKLNSTGALILKSLLDGMTINELLNKTGRNTEKTEEISSFLMAVKNQLEGRLDEFNRNPSVEVIPFEMKFSEYPVLSEVALTYRCNLKCTFCYAGCGCTANPVHSSREMTTGQVKQVLWKIFHQAKVPSVSFTGGEPTLVPELPALVVYAKTLGMRVNLITNGTKITRQMAKDLAASGLDSAQVSIEGVTSATHDRAVGLNGAFEKSVCAIGYLKDAGILTHSNTTMTAGNMAECLALPEFVKQILKNDRFSMNLIIPAGSGSVNENLIVPYRCVGKQIENIVTLSRKTGVDFMWYSPVPMCMFNSILHGLGNKGCSACDGLISVGANGDVLPCASCDDSVGNLLEKDFASIWQSEKAKKYRDKRFAHPQCRKCENFHICNGACPLYWRQVGFTELTEENHWQIYL
jgi:radical SAM protein with 4Fe4S-binding SPASM domain